MNAPNNGIEEVHSIVCKSLTGFVHYSLSLITYPIEQGFI